MILAPSLPGPRHDLDSLDLPGRHKVYTRAWDSRHCPGWTRCLFPCTEVVLGDGVSTGHLGWGVWVAPEPRRPVP